MNESKMLYSNNFEATPRTGDLVRFPSIGEARALMMVTHHKDGTCTEGLVPIFYPGQCELVEASQINVPDSAVHAWRKGHGI